MIKQLYELKSSLDLMEDKTLANYTAVMNQISSRIFYLQSIYDSFESEALSLMKAYLSDMAAYSAKYAETKTNIFVVSIIWVLLTFIVGLIIIASLRGQYFSEVYMITFLNREMIFGNKRVESFLNSLSNNTNF